MNGNSPDPYSYPTLLVNRAWPLRSHIGPDRLTWVENMGYKVLLEREAARMFHALMDATGGWTEIVPTSGYRPRREQEELYAQSLRDNGSAFTEKYVALPGHSEHETGLAVDVALWSDNIDPICPAFPDKGVCRVFRQSAPEFGFIERYPAGKEAVTGIVHEPWHFRYIGREYALAVAESALAYEEFINSL